MSLRSKKLVEAALMLRPEHRKFTKALHPRYIKKLVNITQEPKPLAYKIHPIIPNLILDYPHPAPLKPI